MKEHDTTSEKELDEMEISNLSDKGSKLMVIKMLTWFEERVEELRLQKEKIFKKNLSKLKNTKTEMKNILDGINSTLENEEEQINHLEDRTVEIIQDEQQKEKRT